MFYGCLSLSYQLRLYFSVSIDKGEKEVSPAHDSNPTGHFKQIHSLDFREGVDVYKSAMIIHRNHFKSVYTSYFCYVLERRSPAQCCSKLGVHQDYKTLLTFKLSTHLISQVSVKCIYKLTHLTRKLTEKRLI